LRTRAISASALRPIGLSRSPSEASDFIRGNGPPLIHCGVFTWNCGNAQPSAEGVARWLPEAGGDLDLLAVGTQENKFKRKASKPKKAKQKVLSKWQNGRSSRRQSRGGMASRRASGAASGGASGGESGGESAGEVVSDAPPPPPPPRGMVQEPRNGKGGKLPRRYWELLVLSRLGPGWRVVRCVLALDAHT